VDIPRKLEKGIKLSIKKSWWHLLRKKMRDSYPRWFRPSNKITRLNQVGMRSARGGIWVEVVKKNITYRMLTKSVTLDGVEC